MKYNDIKFNNSYYIIYVYQKNNSLRYVDAYDLSKRFH